VRYGDCALTYEETSLHMSLCVNDLDNCGLDQLPMIHNDIVEESSKMFRATLLLRLTFRSSQLPHGSSDIMTLECSKHW
jgi:hypothetical protein